MLARPMHMLQMRRRREYSRMRSDEAKAEAGANQAGVPAPDIPLQPTFDADNNSHRYRYMEPPPDAALCRYPLDDSAPHINTGFVVSLTLPSLLKLLLKSIVIIWHACELLMQHSQACMHAFTSTLLLRQIVGKLNDSQ